MEFVVYRKFYEQEQLDPVIDILKQNDIEYVVTEDRESLDSLYGDKQFKHQYFVKLKRADFKTVDNILLEQSSRHLDSVDKDHYLFSFSNDELVEILAKPDEWSEFDFLLAQKLLRERGVPVDARSIDELKKERLHELARPDENNTAWIYIGYICAFLGGLLGIFIGWHLSTFKKTLPDGQKVFGYTTKHRSHGNRILMLGIVMLVFWISFRIINH